MTRIIYNSQFSLLYKRHTLRKAFSEQGQRIRWLPHLSTGEYMYVEFLKCINYEHLGILVLLKRIYFLKNSK
jgi:hypothetical protein